MANGQQTTQIAREAPFLEDYRRRLLDTIFAPDTGLASQRIPQFERRIGELEQRITIPQTTFQGSPPSRANGGIMGAMNEPVSYSAMDGSPTGLMTMAEGGKVFLEKQV